MIPKALRGPITNALDRRHTPIEIARIFGLPVEDIEAFSLEMIRGREDKALAILRDSGDALAAERGSGLDAMSIRALKNRLQLEDDELRRSEQAAEAERLRAEAERREEAAANAMAEMARNMAE